MEMQRFTRLKVWQRSHGLVLRVYRETKGFPRDERFGLVAQVRRAAASVPTNIAEGSKRAHNREFGRFLNIAEGSLAELEYGLMLGTDLGMLRRGVADELLGEIDEIARMLHTLRTKVLDESSKL